MIGVGSMGGMMSLLFAELGIEVNFYDPSEEHDHTLLEHAKEAKVEDKIKYRKDYKDLCDNMGSPKVFVFSVLSAVLPTRLSMECGHTSSKTTSCWMHRMSTGITQNEDRND
jgi:6-phosphogluconate dehydrogenase